MNDFSLKRAAFAFAICSFLTASAHSAVVTYSDRGTWESAAGSVTTEDLNTATVGTSFISTTLDLGDFTVLRTGTGFSGQIASGGAGFNIDGTTFGRVDTGSFIGDLVITFDSAISAFGLDVDAWNDSTLRTTVLLDGVTDVPVTTQSGQGSRFFGFTSDSAFNEVRFVGDVGDSWGFDNIAYSSDSGSVPVPATLALFGIGLAGLGYRRRKSE